MSQTEITEELLSKFKEFKPVYRVKATDFIIKENIRRLQLGKRLLTVETTNEIWFWKGSAFDIYHANLHGSGKVFYAKMSEELKVVIKYVHELQKLYLDVTGQELT